MQKTFMHTIIYLNFKLKHLEMVVIQLPQPLS